MPEFLIQTGLSLLSGLFGSGQVRGADFEARKFQAQIWLAKFNLLGTNGKYIDKELFESLLFEDSGWQADVQQYLDVVNRAVNNPSTITSAEGYAKFGQNAISFVNKVNQSYGKLPEVTVDDNKKLGTVADSKNIFVALGLFGAVLYFAYKG